MITMCHLYHLGYLNRSSNKCLKRQCSISPHQIQHQIHILIQNIWIMTYDDSIRLRYVLKCGYQMKCQRHHYAQYIGFPCLSLPFL